MKNKVRESPIEIHRQKSFEHKGYLLILWIDSKIRVPVASCFSLLALIRTLVCMAVLQVVGLRYFVFLEIQMIRLQQISMLRR